MWNETRTIDLETQIAAEYASLLDHIEGRLVPLLVRRASLKAAVPAAGSVSDAPCAAVVPFADDRQPEAASAPRRQAPRMRAHTAQLVVDALWEAPFHRLPGAALNRVVVDAGYTRDAAEKVTTRLRMLGVLIKDARIGFWSLGPVHPRTGGGNPGHGRPGRRRAGSRGRPRHRRGADRRRRSRADGRRPPHGGSTAGHPADTDRFGT